MTGTLEYEDVIEDLAMNDAWDEAADENESSQLARLRRARRLARRFRPRRKLVTSTSFKKAFAVLQRSVRRNRKEIGLLKKAAALQKKVHRRDVRSLQKDIGLMMQFSLMSVLLLKPELELERFVVPQDGDSGSPGDGVFISAAAPPTQLSLLTDASIKDQSLEQLLVIMSTGLLERAKNFGSESTLPLILALDQSKKSRDGDDKSGLDNNLALLLALMSQDVE